LITTAYAVANRNATEATKKEYLALRFMLFLIYFPLH